jgi:hypothetical protein
VRLLHSRVLAISVEEVVIFDISPFSTGPPGQVERIECIPQRIVQLRVSRFSVISPPSPWSINAPDRVSVSLFVGSVVHVLQIPSTRSAAACHRTISLPQTPHPEGSSIGHSRGFQCQEPENPVFNMVLYPPQGRSALWDDSTSQGCGGRGRLERTLVFPEDLGGYNVLFDEHSGRVILKASRPWNEEYSRSGGSHDSLASYLGIDTLLLVHFA